MTESAVTPTLHAVQRSTFGHQVGQLRRSGSVPAVMYGNKKESSSLVLNTREFDKLYAHAGTTTLINLVVGEDKPVKVLVHDLQRDPTTRRTIHIDFYQVNLKEKLHTEIPLEFVGTADVIELDGATFITVKDHVNVECLPEDLVQHIEVDISGLKTFDDTLHISDIIVPAGITIMDEVEETIASLAAPRSDEELAALDEVPEVEDAAAIEAEHGGEEVVEGEEGAEGEGENKPEAAAEDKDKKE